MNTNRMKRIVEQARKAHQSNDEERTNHLVQLFDGEQKEVNASQTRDMVRDMQRHADIREDFLATMRDFSELLKEIKESRPS